MSTRWPLRMRHLSLRAREPTSGARGRLEQALRGGLAVDLEASTAIEAPRTVSRWWRAINPPASSWRSRAGESRPPREPCRSRHARSGACTARAGSRSARRSRGTRRGPPLLRSPPCSGRSWPPQTTSPGFGRIWLRLARDSAVLVGAERQREAVCERSFLCSPLPGGLPAALFKKRRWRGSAVTGGRPTDHRPTPRVDPPVACALWAVVTLRELTRLHRKRDTGV